MSAAAALRQSRSAKLFEESPSAAGRAGVWRMIRSPVAAAKRGSKRGGAGLQRTAKDTEERRRP